MPHPLISLAISLPNIGSTLLTIFGIGLVIFVHEFGHFLCARKVGVRVEIFSLGYGPRLFGWVRRGTDFRVSAVPVGGYVKMAGSEPTECEGLPDELLSRTVGERILIFSGGVVMNVLFALLVFPTIFAIGVPMEDARIGTVGSGGPGWKAGLREGDEILAVNGREVLGFSDVSLEIAFADPDRATMSIRRDGALREVVLRPEYDKELGSYVARIAPQQEYRVRPGGAAAACGATPGDRVVEIDHAPLSDRSLQRSLGFDDTPLSLTLERADGSRYDLVVPPEKGPRSERPLIGILPLETRVAGVRGAFSGGPLIDGDEVRAAFGRSVVSAADVAAAAKFAKDHPGDGPPTLRVARDGVERDLALTPAQIAALADDVAFGNVDGPSPDGVPVFVQPGAPAERAGVASGDRVRSVDGVDVSEYSKLRERILAADGAIRLSVTRGGVAREISVVPEFQDARDYGIDLDQPRVVKQFPIGRAFGVGVHASWNFARQAVLALRKMVSREIDPKNLGGIVAISHASYTFAQLGIAKLFYFLALLSINLAIINFLPIPLLDGGQVLFLLIEKVKGSPVSDRVAGYSQIVGLVIILSLLIFVTYNDIARLL